MPDRFFKFVCGGVILFILYLMNSLHIMDLGDKVQVKVVKGHNRKENK